MVTISRIVEKIIEDNPILQEAIHRQIINYAALAENIKPQVEREMKISVKTSAVMMALRRLGDKLEKSFVKTAKFDKDADIFIKSDLFEITLKKSKKTYSLIKDVYEKIDPEKDFLTITQGLSQITLISNKRNKKRITEIFGREKIVKEINDLACISTTLPINAIDQVGYFYNITRGFAWENLPIIEIVSTFTELSFIVREKDVPKSFLVFKEIINRNS